jgi:hypothetical protein
MPQEDEKQKFRPDSQPASDVVLDFNIDVLKMSEKLKNKFKRISGKISHSVMLVQRRSISTAC